jgi:regulator of replication initiation timing
MKYCEKKHMVSELFMVLLVIVVALVWSHKAFGEQKLTTPPQGTNIEKSGVIMKSVDMTQVLKNQLASCQKDSEELQKQNNTLQQENKTLKQQNADLQKKLKDVTVPGGSAVKAYCESPTVSRNTAGAINNCASSGYMCEPVSGLCRTSCSKTDGQCASGYVCDPPFSGHCIPNN